MPFVGIRAGYLLQLFFALPRSAQGFSGVVERMSGREETEDELDKRLQKIREVGPDPIIQALKDKKNRARATSLLAPKIAPTIRAEKTEHISVLEDFSPKPITEEQCDQLIEEQERQEELGLGNFPFPGMATFQKLDAQGKPIKYTAKDIAEIVSSWYVRKDTKYFDINRLGVPLSPADVQQSIMPR